MRPTKKELEKAKARLEKIKNITEFDEIFGNSHEEDVKLAEKEVKRHQWRVDNPERHAKKMEKLFGGSKLANFDGTPKFE
jgi:hypothetical protein